MLNLNDAELKFITNTECCRLATSLADKPHVVPVSYILIDGLLYIATDYDTKKFRNILHNPVASMVIDVYAPRHHKGIVIFGTVKIIEGGDLFKKIYSIFYKKFDWVRGDPWVEGESPFLEITPISKVSWGI